ncbi:MlaD family protein [Shewanella sp. 1_MG-2023]|uniref:MlaD family protein n=1 Tax=unclassified Shewanella TaxID=196818 RepID=UPI0026E1C1AC|nr:MULTISPECIES: MlaD family protein [unclassified Shewanella]MDO6611821.1 MlaD family protein [Shewanella sp. 7_MG-2023]MDO6771676.1 MlaD family protein [Shewanella sp. 2_MG-2023]MDO6793902.1 MlaD family protein [Shewanella sp. 1_MG-2023]
MTRIESPKVVKKKLFSPIWLLPIVALVLGAWLGVKSIKESGIEIQVHFPSAIGIDVGKTLVKYQGLTVGKVTDISLDKDLSGVNVKIVMDYRSDPFLNKNTLFWLVTPKASITGIEGLDTLFSGNYIAIEPGDGSSTSEFIASTEAPSMIPNEEEGIVVKLTTPTLGSLDVGSLVFYRQVPVGKVVNYRLIDSDTIIISTFIEQQYAHLVNQNSQFWNVSGLKIDASLSGIKVNTESLASLLAGGISFNSDTKADKAITGDNYVLYPDEESAVKGVEFVLTADNADEINQGSALVYRGIEVGKVHQTQLTENGVKFSAKFDIEYQHLLNADSQFWVAGADISMDGVKHVSRLLTGSVVNVLPGVSDETLPEKFTLLKQSPDLLNDSKLKIQLSSDEHSGLTAGAEVRYKQMPIGEITRVTFTKDFSGVEYQVEILPEYKGLITTDSHFVSESALTIDASLDGVSVTTRDLNTVIAGAVSLVRGKTKALVRANSQFALYRSTDHATATLSKNSVTTLTLDSIDGAGLSDGSPIYYKKMQIGKVTEVNWNNKTDQFSISLAIQNKFSQLIRDNSVFWRNDAASINASLSGVEVNVAPLEGALKGSLSLGLLSDELIGNQQRLYDSKELALKQAQTITLVLPAEAKVAAKAAIRYQGHQIGVVQQVKLNQDLDTLTASAYLYGEYAGHFTKADTEYFIVDAQISLAGIKAPETLITGPYIGVIPGKVSDAIDTFEAHLSARYDADIEDDALTLILEDSQLGSIKVGTPIFFRGISIGQVDGYTLSDNGNKVLMYSHIEKQYTHLVNQSSRFWDASGIKLEVGIFSGAQIETGSLETLLSGGISVVTEDVTSEQNKLSDNSRFDLYNKMKEEWRRWQPEQVKP